MILRPRFDRADFVVRALALLLLVSPLALGVLTLQARAEEPAKKKEISASYKKIVRGLLETSGAQMTGEQVAYSVAQETLGTIASTGTPITEEIQKIVVEGALQEFGGKFGDLDYLTSLYAPLYAEHLTEPEIRALLTFYQSPAGKKALVALPQVMQGAMYSLQQASLEKLPDFQVKVDERLREAGIVVVPE